AHPSPPHHQLGGEGGDGVSFCTQHARRKAGTRLSGFLIALYRVSKVPRTSEDSRTIGQHREDLCGRPACSVPLMWEYTMIGEVWYVTALACPRRFLRGRAHRERRW